MNNSRTAAKYENHMMRPLPHRFLIKFHIDAAMSPKNARPAMQTNTRVGHKGQLHPSRNCRDREAPRRQMYTSVGSHQLANIASVFSSSFLIQQSGFRSNITGSENDEFLPQRHGALPSAVIIGRHRSAKGVYNPGQCVRRLMSRNIATFRTSIVIHVPDVPKRTEAAITAPSQMLLRVRIGPEHHACPDRRTIVSEPSAK